MIKSNGYIVGKESYKQEKNISTKILNVTSYLRLNKKASLKYRTFFSVKYAIPNHVFVKQKLELLV